MHATEWFSLMNTKEPGFSKDTWITVGHSECTEEADQRVANFLQAYATRYGYDVKITAITWKEERLRPERRLVSRQYTPKPKVAEDVIAPEPVVSDEPIQPDLNLSVSPSLNEVLILALKDNTAAQRDLTRATWAVERKLRTLLPKDGDC